jgi:hypothetical protein
MRVGKGDTLRFPESPPRARLIRDWLAEHGSLLLTSTTIAICLLSTIGFRVIRSHAATLPRPQAPAHAPTEAKAEPNGPRESAPSYSFGHLKTQVRSVRIVGDAAEQLRTRVQIEVENTHPNRRDDDFEFSPLACELADNFGNEYQPIPPSDLELGLYDRRPLYPRRRRTIEVAFEPPVAGVRWLELRMTPPTRRSRGGARMRLGIPVGMVEGLEKLDQRRSVVSLGCEEE